MNTVVDYSESGLKKHVKAFEMYFLRRSNPYFT